MIITELKDFLHMGGYGTYVWLSYGFAFSIIFANFVWSMKRRRKVIRDIRRNLMRALDEF